MELAPRLNVLLIHNPRANNNKILSRSIDCADYVLPDSESMSPQYIIVRCSHGKPGLEQFGILDIHRHSVYV